MKRTSICTYDGKFLGSNGRIFGSSWPHLWGVFGYSVIQQSYAGEALQTKSDVFSKNAHIGVYLSAPIVMTARSYFHE